MSSPSTITEDFGDAVLIIGGGLAGLAAAHELTKANRKVVILDQEPEASLGGQAFWSYGGIFFVDSPQQRWMGIKDSYELARRDWFNSAQFDRPNTDDKWAIRWAEEYLRYAVDPDSGMYKYLYDLGLGIMPLVGWAERGAGSASGHGNSVPRFHITWGTGPGLVDIFVKPVRAAAEKGLAKFLFRHKVEQLTMSSDGKSVVGAEGTILEASDVVRGAQSSRVSSGQTFAYKARATIVATGGIGGNPELIRQLWPTNVLGKCPDNFVLGVPHHVDGSGLALGKNAGGAIVNPDRLWFYTEGVQNWNSIWPDHGIRIIAGPSSFWLDAEGERLPAPLYPGCDTISTFKHILSTGYDYTWLIMDSKILKKEMALSGSEQNLDITNKSLLGLIDRLRYGSKGVRDFVEHGVDWITRDTLEELVEGMNELVAKDADRKHPEKPLEAQRIYDQIHDRDIETENAFSKDPQLALISQARQCRSERLFRVTPPHKVLDPSNGPLLAIRLSLLSRKTLGGLQTNLDSQVLQGDHETPVRGLYAAGEVCGFGGGGMMGYNALEGTFVTGCIFSGMRAGQALAKADAKL